MAKQKQTEQEAPSAEPQPEAMEAPSAEPQPEAPSAEPQPEAPSAEQQPEATEALIAADTKPNDDPNPAPGAANYEPPELHPKPGTTEYLLAHPGEITNGTVTR